MRGKGEGTGKRVPGRSLCGCGSWSPGLLIVRQLILSLVLLLLLSLSLSLVLLLLRLQLLPTRRPPWPPPLGLQLLRPCNCRLTIPPPRTWSPPARSWPPMLAGLLGRRRRRRAIALDASALVRALPAPRFSPRARLEPCAPRL